MGGKIAVRSTKNDITKKNITVQALPFSRNSNDFFLNTIQLSKAWLTWRFVALLILKLNTSMSENWTTSKSCPMLETNNNDNKSVFSLGTIDFMDQTYHNSYHTSCLITHHLLKYTSSDLLFLPVLNHIRWGSTIYSVISATQLSH